MLYQQFALGAVDPALSTRWYVLVPGATSPTFAVAESVNVTFRKIPSKSRYRTGKNANYADNSEIDGITIVFFETADFQVTKWLKKWREMVFHPDGTYGLPAQFKKDITVQLLGIDSMSPKMTVKYTGCWPTDQSPWALDYEAADGRIKVEAQFAVDDMEML